VTATEIIATITSAGGRIWVEGDKVRARLPESLRPLVSEIKLRKPELLEELLRQPAQIDLPDELRGAFIAWFDFRIRLDAKALALRLPPRWSTSVSALYRDHCEWMSGRDTVPPTPDEFLLLLQELGVTIRAIGTDQFADHIALKEDVEAHEQFQRLPLPEPGERGPGDPGEAALERVPVPILAPATTPDGTPLPPGCRIVEWAPKEAPVRLTSSTVTDVPRFVQSTLAQIAAELKGRHWLGGHWGGVPGLLDRLKAVGCVIEVDQPPGPKGGAQ
jgi:hypothetical protein